MIYTAQTVKAMKFAYEAHHGQLDKGGVPYIFHPIHLAEQMNDEQTTVTALLHDVIEDTDCTAGQLRELGFDKEVVDAVELMTHDKAVPYMQYIERLAHDPIARTVKLADLRHNSDLSRIGETGGKDTERAAKYRQAAEILENAK